jgi:ParB family transcriptional regulator, chromosome partitioning protein
MNNPTNLRHVPTADIEDPLLGELMDEQQVTALAESIGEVGLIHPITLEEIADGWRVRAGRHRLAAVRRRGDSHVPAIVLPEGTSPAVAELITIDENLRRRRLSDLEEAQALARRRVLYERLHPQAATKKGRPKKLADNGAKPKKKPFAQATAEQTGRSRRTVERDTSLGERIDPKAAERLTGANHPVCRNKTELAKLAELPAPQQRLVAGQLAAGKLQRVPDNKVSGGKVSGGKVSGGKVSGVRCQVSGKKQTREAVDDPVWESIEQSVQEWVGDDPTRRSVAAAWLENLAQRVRG